MIYELATLQLRIGSTPKATEGVKAYLAGPESKGTLLGCWVTDIGQLNRMVILRGFEQLNEMAAQRERMLHGTDPFGAGDALVGLEIDSYTPFPFIPPVKPGRYGGVYEIRTYVVKPNGLDGLRAAWEEALPDRLKISPLTVAMHTLDGPTRFTHIWPYADTNARAATRAQAMATGKWPPKGGPNWLTGDMTSTIALPTDFSPLA